MKQGIREVKNSKPINFTDSGSGGSRSMQMSSFYAPAVEGGGSIGTNRQKSFARTVRASIDKLDAIKGNTELSTYEKSDYASQSYSKSESHLAGMLQSGVTELEAEIGGLTKELYSSKPYGLTQVQMQSSNIIYDQFMSGNADLTNENVAKQVLNLCHNGIINDDKTIKKLNSIYSPDTVAGIESKYEEIGSLSKMGEEFSKASRAFVSNEHTTVEL